MKSTTRLAMSTVLATLLLAQIALPAAAHNASVEERIDTVGLRIDLPIQLQEFFPGEHWDGSAAVDDQMGQLVYAGAGCTPLSYATVDVAGAIAVTNAGASATNPADQCPASTWAQRIQAAEAAGAIGVVHIEALGEEPGGASALSGSIPGITIAGTEEAYALRDTIIAGTEVFATVAKPDPLPAFSDVACVDGMAGPFECDGIDLLSLTPADVMDSAGISDIWGWTDPDNGDEYVIMGKTNGTAFFNVTDPYAPTYLGELPNPALLAATWHDMKVYANHVYIVSESTGHGMSVFDLTQLRGVTEPQTWDATFRYPLNDAAHNIAINTDTGFAYLVGGNEALAAPDQCLQGLHMIDLADPANPTFAGCYATDGGPGTGARTVGEPVMEHSPVAYVHDTQCVIYDGPDDDHDGQELCFNMSEDQLAIADVTDKLLPSTIGVLPYKDATYAHQGWLTEDHAFFIANDELDEQEHGFNTRTLVFDVRDLENPTLLYEHEHDVAAIDHNAYVVGDRVFQSNYTAGLRVLDISDIENGMSQAAFFDTFPAHNDPTFEGTWSNYPYFESGTIAISGRGEGLFLVRLQTDGTPSAGSNDGGVDASDQDGAPTLPATGAGFVLGSLGLLAIATRTRPRRS